MIAMDWERCKKQLQTFAGICTYVGVFINIDISNLKDGIYFVWLNTDHQIVSRSIFKQE